MAHADSHVSDEEVRVMAEALIDVPFSKEQRKILEQDTREAQDVMKMFAGVTDPRDRAKFFEFARKMVNADGHFSPDEQHILLKLKEMHMSSVNVDELVGSIELQLEDEAPAPRAAVPPKKDAEGFLARFKKIFKD